MKKFVSFLMAVLMMCTILTAMAIPAFAEDPPIECSVDRGSINIRNPGNYIISQTCTVRELAITNENSKLIIPEGVTVTVNSDTSFSLRGTIDLYGTLDVSQYAGAYIPENRINIADTGNLIKPNSMNNDQIIENPYVEGNVGKLFKASVLSDGSLTIIVGITAAVVFGLGGFFIGKAAGKKKKTALASGTDNTDEE